MTTFNKKKKMPTIKDLIPYFESLAGDKYQNGLTESQLNISILEDGDAIGYSQFNELLLLLGFNSISKHFFQFLIDGNIEYVRGSSINSEKEFKESIDRFEKLALLSFGSISVAFKRFSTDLQWLKKAVNSRVKIEPTHYIVRPKPVIKINEIPPDKTYLLGEITSERIVKEYKDNPDKVDIQKLYNELKQYSEKGKSNQIAYLTSDYLDVYVATSMRENHEFIFVNEIINKIFKSGKLEPLKLRWFDPTQAKCSERVDKGLSEALMLKRATCTLYLAQENDTLGKDSELASTLAQGKPVVVYIPNGNKTFVDNLIESLLSFEENISEKQVILNQLKIYNPKLAWDDPEVRNWISDIESVEINCLKERLYNTVEAFYNKRADTLINKHPLGIQVNLNSGVANGVLVVRDINSCIEILYKILTNTLEFEIRRKYIDKKEYLYLHENISDSTFRIKTGNVLLTSTFWNFYLKS